MKIAQCLPALVLASSFFFVYPHAKADCAGAAQASARAETPAARATSSYVAASSHWLTDDTSAERKAAILVIGTFEAGPLVVDMLRKELGQENFAQFLRGEGLLLLDRRREVPMGEVVESAAMDPRFKTLLHLGSTAVAVGPRAILTAAHNVTPTGLRIDTNDIQADCDVAPGYPDDDSADVALCRTAAGLGRSPYEPIFLGAAQPQSFTHVTLTGFGCAAMEESATAALSFRSEVAVKVWPSSTSHFLEVDHCLCDGDSGGPAFANLSDGRRVIVAVNARGRCRAANGEWVFCTQAGADCAQVTSTSSLKDFIQGWADGRPGYRKDNSTDVIRVCGVNTTAADTFCR